MKTTFINTYPTLYLQLTFSECLKAESVQACICVTVLQQTCHFNEMLLG